MQTHQILLEPVVTEKSTMESAQNKHTFRVHAKATKVDIKNAIKAFYGLDAVSVNIRKTPKKIRLVGRGREITKRAATKKATVTLKEGQKLDIHKFTSAKKK